MTTPEELVAQAFEAREYAYAPYSRFKVGAALLCKDGKIFKGCNIESASYSPSNCAERTAIFKAVSEGSRDFVCIAVVGGHEESSTDIADYCAPCGVCRQVMMEFCSPETFKIILARNESDYKVYTLKELLPIGFGPDNL
jgi:cytidine deaminase